MQCGDSVDALLALRELALLAKSWRARGPFLRYVWGWSGEHLLRIGAFWVGLARFWFALGGRTAALYLVAAWLAGTVGVMCFHLQHHCNAPYREASAVKRSAWTRHC